VIYEAKNVGSAGILNDMPPHELPPEAWTYGENVRADKNQIKSTGGYISSTTPTVEPYHLTVTKEPDNDDIWVYFGLAKAYSYNGTTHTNVTRYTSTPGDDDYTMASTDVWDSTVFNGVVIANNGVDLPQFMSPIAAATILDDLTNWTSTWRCNAMRQFKQFLVAVDITKSSTRYPFMVKWSHPADAGAVPSSWDETDATKLAGEQILPDEGGAVVDCLQLRGSNIIYKEDATWIMNYIGGQLVFSFDLLYNNSGILTKNCAVEFHGRHFVVTQDDVIIHDGQSAPQSVANRKVREMLFSAMDSSAKNQTFVYYHEVENEIWVCYPEEGYNNCNKALAWNTNDGSWTIRTLPNVHHIASAPFTIGGSTGLNWDDYADNWDDQNAGWAENPYGNPILEQPVAASADTDLYQLDAGNQAAGTNVTCYIQRESIPLGNHQRVSMVKSVRPMMEGDAVSIRVGSQMNTEDAITWSPKYTFDPSTDYKIDCRVTGRLHSIRIESEADVEWALQGYQLEYEDHGRR
jgi:hypothetical protein